MPAEYLVFKDVQLCEFEFVKLHPDQVIVVLRDTEGRYNQDQNFGDVYLLSQDINGQPNRVMEHLPPPSEDTPTFRRITASIPNDGVLPEKSPIVYTLDHTEGAPNIYITTVSLARRVRWLPPDVKRLIEPAASTH
jgi:hypothetical protein